MAGVNVAEKNKRYVLVADANIDDRFSTCMLLQRFGCNIFTASTLKEAIEFMSVAAPVAVIADADLIGSVPLAQLKKDPRFLDVPLIILSSSPHATVEEQVRKGECAAYLKKPLQVEKFYQVVQEVIEKGPRRNIRVDTYLMATVGNDLDEGEGYITNLSEYGLFFRTLEPRPVNSHLPVRFEIKGKNIQLEALVLYWSAFNEGPFREPGMGLKFVKINPEDRALIKAYILERVTEGMPK